MKQEYNRRKFIHSAAIAGIGIGLSGSFSSFGKSINQQQKRVGIIGLDTSHSIAFAKAFLKSRRFVSFGRCILECFTNEKGFATSR